MPKRPSLRDRLGQEPEGRGRDAVFGGRSPVDEQRQTVDRPPSTVDAEPDRWEDTHQRVTFYCPRDLLAAVEAEMRRSKRSKSRVIVEAIAEHLGR